MFAICELGLAFPGEGRLRGFQHYFRQYTDLLIFFPCILVSCATAYDSRGGSSWFLKLAGRVGLREFLFKNPSRFVGWLEDAVFRI